MNVLDRMWRWFTLADAPTQDIVPKIYVKSGPRNCSFCPQSPTQVHVDMRINGKSYNVALCPEHNNVKWWLMLS